MRPITQIVHYSTKAAQGLNPWAVTGITDAEGSFIVKLSKTNTSIGFRVQLDFSIGFHIKDIALLKEIRAHFGNVGTVRLMKDNFAFYSVRSLTDIVHHILPHFERYPLITQKMGDYLLFARVAKLMQNGMHLTGPGLQSIVNIRAGMNRGLTPSLVEAFPYTDAVVRPIVPIVENPKDISPH